MEIAHCINCCIDSRAEAIDKYVDRYVSSDWGFPRHSGSPVSITRLEGATGMCRDQQMQGNTSLFHLPLSFTRDFLIITHKSVFIWRRR